MKSQFSQDPLQLSSVQTHSLTNEENVEAGIQISSDSTSGVIGSKYKENLYLNIRFTQICSLPMLVNSISPASIIIEILSRTIPFQNLPILIFKGKILEPMVSLKAQGVQDRDEIVIYEKVVNSMLTIDNQSNPFDSNFLKKLEKKDVVCTDFQTTPFEQKIFSILNEVNRLEDLTNNMENIEPEAPFISDSEESDDDDIDEYETDDFLGADSEECDFNASSYDANLQNCSLSTILNLPDTSSAIPPAKTMKMKMLTVLGPEPKEVSSQPLPTCFQSQMKLSAKNNSIINCPSFKSFEDLSRFFTSNSSTYWKW